jgi:hypothetical protein
MKIRNFYGNPHSTEPVIPRLNMKSLIKASAKIEQTQMEICHSKENAKENYSSQLQSEISMEEHELFSVGNTGLFINQCIMYKRKVNTRNKSQTYRKPQEVVPLVNKRDNTPPPSSRRLIDCNKMKPRGLFDAPIRPQIREEKKIAILNPKLNPQIKVPTQKYNSDNNSNNINSDTNNNNNRNMNKVTSQNLTKENKNEYNREFLGKLSLSRNQENSLEDHSIFIPKVIYFKDLGLYQPPFYMSYLNYENLNPTANSSRNGEVHIYI